MNKDIYIHSQIIITLITKISNFKRKNNIIILERKEYWVQALPTDLLWSHESYK